MTRSNSSKHKLYDHYLSDQLNALQVQFELRHLEGGDTLINADALEAIIDLLDDCLNQAREYEAEISALRWNSKAGLQQIELNNQAIIDTVIEECAKPNSNLLLFNNGNPVQRASDLLPPVGGGAA